MKKTEIEQILGKLEEYPVRIKKDLTKESEVLSRRFMMKYRNFIKEMTEEKDSACEASERCKVPLGYIHAGQKFLDDTERAIRVTKSEAEQELKTIYKDLFNPEGVEWKLADNFQIEGNMLTYVVDNSYIVEVCLTDGASRHCGLGKGCFWTEWEEIIA